MRSDAKFKWRKVSVQTTQDLYAISASKGRPLAIGGGNGIVLIADGNRWRSLPIAPISKDFPKAIVDLVALNRKSVWAISRTSISHWDGRFWVSYSPKVLEGDRHLEFSRIRMSSKSKGYIVGRTLDRDGRIVEWDGKSWKVGQPNFTWADNPSPLIKHPPTEILALDITNEGAAWAGGYENFLELIGNRWEQQKSQIPGHYIARALCLGNTTSGWAMDHDIFFRFGRGTWTRWNKPIEWAHQANLANPEISCDGDREALASGETYSAESQLIGSAIVHFDGEDWIEEYFANGVDIHAIKLMPDGTGWAVGSGGAVFRRN